MSLYVPCECGSRLRPENNVRLLGTGVTGGCVTCWLWKLQLGPLLEQ